MTTNVAAHLAVAEGRGRTVVEDRVRQRLVERAVLSVPGVVARRTMAFGRNFPAITIGGQPDSSRIEVEIAAAWPVDSVDVIEAVRGAVGDELAAALDEHPDRVGVRISHLLAERTAAQVAQAYAAEAAVASSATPRRLGRYAPRAIAASTVTGVLISLVLIAFGALAIRDGLTARPQWIGAVLHWLTGAHWQWWYWPTAVLAAVVGAVLLVVAVKPRRRTHIPVGDGVWVPREIAADWRLRESRSTAITMDGELE